jgi:hypothetical protein
MTIRLDKIIAITAKRGVMTPVMAKNVPIKLYEKAHKKLTITFLRTFLDR